MFRFKEEEKKVGTKANLEKLASEIADMNYTDFTKGEDYASLTKRYSQQGQKAMDDTIGKVAARTGGLASSYATAAGNQAYSGYMEKLEDAARAMYDDQRQEKIDNFGIYKSLYDQEYQEKRDNEADAQWYKNFHTANDQWSQQFNYAVGQGTKEDAQNQILTIIGSAELDENGDLIADIPENLIEASGWDPLTINALKMEALQNKSEGEIPQLTDYDEIEKWRDGILAAETYARAELLARSLAAVDPELAYSLLEQWEEEHKGED